MARKRKDEVRFASPYEMEPLRPEEEEFRHGHWRARRSKVMAALKSSGTGHRAIERFEHCGSGAKVYWDENAKKHRVLANWCRNRHCEPCARARSLIIAMNLRERIAEEKCKDHRFITFTLKHSDAPLLDQVKRLYSSFSKLRQKKEWKTSQKGGAFMLEVKYTEAGWHPHLHVITTGHFIPQLRLRDLWLEVTGDSHVVDIQFIRDDRQVAAYVTKYVAKGADATVWQDEHLAIEWVIASRGIRSCATFGTWRKWRLLRRPKPTGELEYVDRLFSLVWDARNGSMAAKGILLSLRPPGKGDGQPGTMAAGP